jgi:3-dehydroquinate synthase
MNCQLQINLPQRPSSSYPIYLDNSLLINWQSWLTRHFVGKKIIIISDDNVSRLYANQLASNLSQAGYLVCLLDFEAGEASKNLNTKIKLEEQMFEFGCDRHTLCLAVGGGVVGDLTGFIASTYMRGIKYIQIPTTLLAMLDSSVGGKTAINTSYGKNILGSFWQPQAVIIDYGVLFSLPKQQLINGLFEAIKIFLTLDAEMFSFCQNYLANLLALDKNYLIKLIVRAVSLKAMVVEQDEHENNLRMILNFGHSVAHGLEKLSDYNILHGYAVGYGILVEAKVAQLLGLINVDDFIQIEQLLMRLGIKGEDLNNYSADELIQVMRGDKKNRDQQIVLVLLSGIGKVKNQNNIVAFPVDEHIIQQAYDLISKQLRKN